MKIFLFSSLILLSLSIFGQTKLGLKLAPVVASNRVTNDAQNFDKDGSALKLSVGLVVDKPLSDSYFLSTGVTYLPKQVAFKNDTLAESYKSQYLQIPVSLKLFTNEVAPDFKVYFQVGTGVEIKVFDEPEEADFVLVESLNPIDFSVILGAGVEFRAGLSTTLFGGISYQRGLVNAINDTTVSGTDDLQVRNTIVSIDLGVKF
ncbi:MAG: porin family protein [Bacteroidota bacterium]